MNGESRSRVTDAREAETLFSYTLENGLTEMHR
jgi:hypothetical protein